MRKITKILGGTLLVALMSIGLATRLNARNDARLEVRDVLSEDMTKPVSGKVVRFAANEEAGNKISKAKAQIADAGEGKRHIRFVVGIDSMNYADAKFNIVAKDGDTVVKTFADKAVTTAYTHIEAAGVVQSAAQVFGTDYKYLLAFTVNNVPESAWDYKFEVTSSVRTEEAAEWATSEVAEKVITDIAAADEEIDAPAFDWQGIVEGGEGDAFAATNAGKQMTVYKGAPAGHFFNTETKTLNMGIAAGDAAEWWAVQLFAVPANIAVGNEYEVSFDIYSPVAGTIRARQKDYEVVVGNNTISYKTKYLGGTGVDSAPFSLQFASPNSSREEVNKMLNVDGDVNPYVISNFMMREVEKEPVVGPEVPEGPYTVEAISTAGAGNHFRVSWTEDADAITLEPTKADFKVNVGIVADLPVHNLNAEQKFVEFNAVTGAEPNRTVTARLHTETGDKLFEIRVEGGEYAGYSVTDAECTHTPVEPDPDQPEPEVPALNQYFRIQANATGGAANNIIIYWNDADHAVTLKPVLSDFSVNIGSIAYIDFANLNNDHVHFNVVTGAQSERNVSVVLHTAAGDFKVTIVIVGGAYNSYIVEEAECNHTVVEPENPDTPVELPAKPEGAIDLEIGNWNPHGDGFLAVGWKNADLQNANIAEYKATAIINGEEVPFTVMHNDGTMAKFFRNATLGVNIGSSNYIMVLEFTTTDGVVYFAAFNVVNGRPA